MVLTHNQYGNVSKKELIHGLIDINSSFVNDINAKLSGLSEKIKVNVAPKDLYACHRMTRLDRVIIKFKCCKQKQSVMYKHKDLGTKS